MGDDEDMTQETVGQMELLDILSHTMFAIAPTQIGTVDLHDLPALVRAVVAERDLFRDDAIPKAAKIMTGLTQQRDALQARIDAYEGHLEQWEEIDRLIAESSFGTEEARAIQARTPPGVGMAIARAVDHLRERDEAIAERDRLRAVVDALRTYRSLADEAVELQSAEHAVGDALAALDQLDVSPAIGGQTRACPTCGKPYRWQRKWNSGNPKDFLLSDCECEDGDGTPDTGGDE